MEINCGSTTAAPIPSSAWRRRNSANCSILSAIAEFIHILALTGRCFVKSIHAMPIVIAVVLLFCRADHAADIHVAAGESIQKAVDAAAEGETISIDAGVFQERLSITKPVTLQGAGWEKTILKPADAVSSHTDAEKIAFADQVSAATDDRNLMRLIVAFR